VRCQCARAPSCSFATSLGCRTGLRQEIVDIVCVLVWRVQGEIVGFWILRGRARGSVLEDLV